MAGRILHYTFDFVLLSTVAAGVRRSTGYGPDVNALPEGFARSAGESLLGVGETVFGMVQATVVNSQWFKKDPRGTSAR
ncbi:hypothetical protein C8J56DRAFT_778939 [Mycena floridula]|nr:hypothetical protein C8J56DRAFT_778939 [Mycena floridula]